jgi:2-hydroxy-3-keto-5-methylthiopentenyl-1-phosphate phosphatase
LYCPGAAPDPNVRRRVLQRDPRRPCEHAPHAQVRGLPFVRGARLNDASGTTVLLDWDGTVTTDDTLILALREFGDWQVYLDAAAALARGEITLHEEIRRDAESITTPIHEVVDWLVGNLELRPGFHELAEAYRPTIVSSNFRQLIDPILERERLVLEVRANKVEWHPGGWSATFRNGDACGTCGEPCKRLDVTSAGAGEIVYVGDGYSDRCAAQAADRVFARDGLARYLDEHGVAYEPYDDLRDVVRALGPAA